ncbi:hypothetical protein LEP1GSC036_2820 [Leptospira weilii str. 2006001853]|uniref:Uncharacterized protein n=2 Tax=Leptospira weilii TaxID=28184 RepID=A0A828Z4Y8_9LEPT|nr:hypothetical protein LEP1GSC036_2820 [Leptospira weilii str. 2006001853]EMM71245.1 hypothetical protein LEP1GSC038_2989 [Leptospira weilii str. 2006001855]EMN43980.1 hypothetical protein LEP1GSC086_4319 [Leptospira weilii str. LNT 1234]
MEFELCKSILKMWKLQQIAILRANSKSRDPTFRKFFLIFLRQVHVQLWASNWRVWVTRTVQVVAYTGANAGFVWYQKRQLGGHAEFNAEIVISPVGASAIEDSKIGMEGIEST